MGDNTIATFAAIITSNNRFNRIRERMGNDYLFSILNWARPFIFFLFVILWSTRSKDIGFIFTNMVFFRYYIVCRTPFYM